MIEGASSVAGVDDVGLRATDGPLVHRPTSATSERLAAETRRIKDEVATSASDPFPAVESTRRADVEQVVRRTIDREMRKLARIAKWQNFEDGIDNEFAAGIRELVNRFGPSAVEAISRAHADGFLTPGAMAEALIWLGRMQSPPTLEVRFYTMIHALRDQSSPQVRHGAVLGISSMEDPRAVPYLADAAANETLGDLKRWILQAAKELSNNSQ
jgi:hypothetical protein